MSVSDLHICKDSICSSKSKSDSCICGPEYYCAYICPESDYTVDTIISWQHFPRSTSSRSRCDDSGSDLQKSFSITPTLTPIKEEEEEKESLKPPSTEYPITKSFSQLNALHYLEVRHVFEFFNFLISHLVCNEPEDPVEFLVQLLGKCLKYRDSIGDPPLLFTSAHVKSLYTAFDPFERGYLTLCQYAEAMRSLGLQNSITPYNKGPPLNGDGYVEENFFIFEAERCLIENIKKMIRIPKLWEENRLLWRKKMEKKAQKELFKKLSELKTGTDEEECEVEKKVKDFCTCNKQISIFCQCSPVSETQHEPEQLFLD